MSIKIIEVSGAANSSNQMTYMIESEDVVAELPTNVAPMSTAITNDGILFVLGTDGVWRKW